MSRKIAVITGTRAEYGMLSWIMRELQVRNAELQVIVTGAHLSADHGMTVKQIEADGMPISAKVDMQLTSDRPLDITRSMGIGLSGIAEALGRLKPDIVVILGDRYEMLAAASAAFMLNIPIAHIRGGEVTEGAIDESIRHAITKLSYWHFAATDLYASRIVQMGEQPERVFTVGDPIIDNLARLPLLSRAELEKELGIALTSPVILFTYHPETICRIPVGDQIATVLAALQEFPDTTLLITGANADTGGREINTVLQVFAEKRKNTLFRFSFGPLLYSSAMTHCNVVAGNSSSAMNEAPTLGKATVNIGDRQKGRIPFPSIITCPCEKADIVNSIGRAISLEFQKALKKSDMFGVPGEVGKDIAELLTSLPLPASLRKPFYDQATPVSFAKGNKL